ncbi:MAG: ankyrin repeat domain-containing protein, partial [Alphaproteobacteria bacterium]|nr:ankyrin repeat domain-containing protein [Alphaproteobacteria bacterium]
MIDHKKYIAQDLIKHVRNGDHHSVLTCLNLGANTEEIPASYIQRETALHQACKFGHLDIVQTLVKFGADVHAKDFVGKTPYEHARNNQHYDVAEFIARAIALSLIR